MQFIHTNDGSNTLYSQQYQQNFHDTTTGALSEALSKHVIPAFTHHEKQAHYKILDICYGLGYNTLATLYYIHKHKLNVTLEIYSPELDETLVNSLNTFEYPQEFDFLKEVIEALSTQHYFENNQYKITLGIENARSFIKTLDNIDIVYQDAFSSEVNKELWSKEYFEDIYACSKRTMIMTTYSIATPVRLSMYEAGFEIYEIKPIKRKQTVAVKYQKNIDGKYIDMKKKRQNNQKASAIYD